jgi:hypothetical protein
MKTYAKTCIFCEVVYTNFTHDRELTVVRLCNNPEHRNIEAKGGKFSCLIATKPKRDRGPLSIAIRVRQVEL